MRSFFFILPLLSAAACASSPKERIADTLTAYGLDRQRAECMGGHIQRDLSTGQLIQLAQAARAYRDKDTDPGRLGLDDLLRVSSQIKDPKIPLTIARAGGRCGLVPLGFTSMVDALIA